MRHCSFCSLLCSYESESELADCELRTRCISELKERPSRTPSVDGRDSTLNDAVEAARTLLQNSPAVLVTGKIHSLETSRVAIELGRSLGATIDLAESQAAFDWLQAVQAGGCFTTTINEARFRSDLIVLLGDEADFEKYPRLLHQLLDCPAPLRERRLLFFGEFSPDFLKKCYAIATSYNNTRSDCIQVASDDLWQVLKAAGRPDSQDYDAAVSEVVQQLKQNVDKSENVVFVFSATADYANGTEVYRSLNEYIFNLASERKAAALPLSSQSLVFSQCCTWQTGFPGRIDFIDQIARYNPWLNRSDRWMTRTSNGALIVVIDESVAKSEISFKKASEPDGVPLVSLPVATCGAESLSKFYKVDGSTMLSCGEDSLVPGASQVLRMILAD